MHTLKSVLESPKAPELRPWPEIAPDSGKPALWWQR